MARLIVAGNMGIDLRVPHQVEGASYAKLPALDYQVGGQALNTAVVASRLGTNVAVVGAIGGDAFGDSVVQELSRESIDTTRLRRDANSTTPVRLIQTDANGCEHVAYHPGTNESYELPATVFRSPCSVFHIAAPEMIDAIWPHRAVEIVRQLKVAGRTVSLATHADGHSPNEFERNTTEHRHLLELVDVVITSEGEARLISRRSEWESMVRYFHERGVSVVVIKRGDKGAVVSWKGRIESVPATRVEVVDTAGAGDSFSAGFLTGLMKRKDPLYCTRLGCIVAGLSVRAPGALEGTADPELIGRAMSVLEKKRESAAL